jgi:hypothetical protein
MDSRARRVIGAKKRGGREQLRRSSQDRLSFLLDPPLKGTARVVPPSTRISIDPSEYPLLPKSTEAMLCSEMTQWAIDGRRFTALLTEPLAVSVAYRSTQTRRRTAR